MKYSLLIYFSLLTEACWIFEFPISILAFAASRPMTVTAKDNTHEQSSKRILAQQIIEELGGQKHAICSDLRKYCGFEKNYPRMAKIENDRTRQLVLKTKFEKVCQLFQNIRHTTAHASP